MEEYEEATELIEPFHEVDIPKNRTLFNFNVNKRKRIIKENSDKLKDKKNYYDKKRYKKLLETMKNVKNNNSDNINHIKNSKYNLTDILSDNYHKKNIKNFPNLTEEHLLQKRIPENLLGYMDPYEISLITNSNSIKKNTKLNNKSNKPLQQSSNQKEYCPTEITYNNTNNNDFVYDNYIYYNYTDANNFDGVDFNLISSINQEQKKITKKLHKLNPEMKNEIKINKCNRKLRPKSSLYSIPRYYYIPNTSNYKHINLKKEEIFDGKFYTKKKKKDMSTISSRLHKFKGITQKEYYNPHELYLSNNKEENLIKKKSRKVNRNLNIIKKTLLLDKNNTHRCIENVKTQRFKKENKNELYLKKEIKKEVLIATQIDTHGAIEKVAMNPFGQLKRIIAITNRKGEDLISSILDSTVTKFCKKENFEIFMRNKAYKDFHIRLKREEEENKKRKERKKRAEENDFLILKLEKNIIKIKNDLNEKYPNHKII